jgi:hypothetical protein
MKWIDFTHLEAAEKPVKEDVLELVDKYRMRDIMSFKYDWNIEVLAQFHVLSSMRTAKRPFTG